MSSSLETDVLFLESDVSTARIFTLLRLDGLNRFASARAPVGEGRLVTRSLKGPLDSEPTTVLALVRVPFRCAHPIGP